jgi:hypothetical protein
MWLEAQEKKRKEKKRKVFVVRKSFRATVLLGGFNLISRVFSVENLPPRLPFSDVRAALTFD